MKKLLFSLALVMTMMVFATETPTAVRKGIAKYGTVEQIVDFEKVKSDDGKEYYEVYLETNTTSYYLEIDMAGKVITVEESELEGDEMEDMEESQD